MNGRKAGAIALILLASALFVSGAETVARDPNFWHSSGLGVSRAVGAFLLPMLILTLGLYYLRDPDRVEED